jgi:hypothetical protein
MDYKPILGATMGLQATSLLAQNMKKKKRKCMFGQGVQNIAGISLLNAQASMI